MEIKKHKGNATIKAMQNMLSSTYKIGGQLLQQPNDNEEQLSWGFESPRMRVCVSVFCLPYKIN